MKSKLFRVSLVLCAILAVLLFNGCKKELAQKELTEQKLRAKMESVKKMLQTTRIKKLDFKFDDRSLYLQKLLQAPKLESAKKLSLKAEDLIVDNSSSSPFIVTCRVEYLEGGVIREISEILATSQVLSPSGDTRIDPDGTVTSIAAALVDTYETWGPVPASYLYVYFQGEIHYNIVITSGDLTMSDTMQYPYSSYIRLPF